VDGFPQRNGCGLKEAQKNQAKLEGWNESEHQELAVNEDRSDKGTQDQANDHTSDRGGAQAEVKPLGYHSSTASGIEPVN